MQCNEKSQLPPIIHRVGEALRAALFLSLGLVTIGQAGCQTATAPAADPPSKVRVDDPAPLSAEDEAQIAKLLAKADEALAADHLTYPANGSALTLFDAVRAIDPENRAAQRGLERIVERYVQMAERALDRNQLHRGRSMLDRARIVDSDHPAIAPSERRLELLQSARRTRLRIDGEALRAKTPQLRAALADIGAAARQAGCRATIRISNDADGRWIYQNMSGGPDTPRVRAAVQIGAPPQVEVLCFDQ